MRSVLDVGREGVAGETGEDEVAAASRAGVGLADDVADVVDVVEVVAVAPAQGVGAAAAVEGVVAGAAAQAVGVAVAGEAVGVRRCR
jgi:hypothetical protein